MSTFLYGGVWICEGPGYERTVRVHPLYLAVILRCRIPRRQINEKERIEENPHFLCENCYNIQFAFCDELKAYITGFVRSGNTYTANGAAEMIKEIVAHIKTDDLEILFRMDSGYFDDVIIEAIKSAGCKF